MLSRRLIGPVLLIVAAGAALASPPPEPASPDAQATPGDAPEADTVVPATPPPPLERPATPPIDPLDLRARLHPFPELPAEDLLGHPAPPPAASLGTTSHGELHEGVEIPFDGEALAVMRTHHKRERNFASAALERALTEAADEVAEAYPGTRTYIGDISQRGGGDIRGHRSHNSGRDVDVAFFALNEEGERVNVSAFLTFDEEGRCCDGRYTFDDARNWRFVRSLVIHPEHEAQYIFVSDPLRQRLLDHAARVGDDPEIIRRASSILRQPSDSAPHDDHFHVRVFCSRRDVLIGCLNRGPRWSWARLHDDARAYRAAVLLDHIAHSPDLESRRSAMRRLDRLELKMATPALAERLLHPELGGQVVEELEDMGVHPASAPALEAALERATDPELELRLLHLLARTDAVSAIPTFVRLATAPGEAREDVRAEAVRALGSLRHRDAAPSLIALLEHDDARLAARARRSLQRITNHAGPTHSLYTDEDRAALAEHWRGWWSEKGQDTRDAWLVAGFAEVGIDMERLRDPAAVPALIEAHLEQPEFITDNAHEVIMDTVDYWYSSAKSPNKRYWFWRYWWSRNSWRFEPDADEAVTAAAEEADDDAPDEGAE